MTYCANPHNQKYKDHFQVGVYLCSQCDTQLFNAKSKYAHGSPWPAFNEPVKEGLFRKEVETQPQTSSDKPSMKIFCIKCDNILGHEFLGDGPDGGSRF